MDEPACVPADLVLVDVTAPPVKPGNLEVLLRRLLPPSPLSTPPPRPIPIYRENLLEGLLSGAPAPTPTQPPQTGITGIETLLQRLLAGTPVPALRSRPGPARRDWTTIVCFFRVANRAMGWAGARNLMRHSRTCYWYGRRRR